MLMVSYFPIVVAEGEGEGGEEGVCMCVCVLYGRRSGPVQCVICNFDIFKSNYQVQRP